jgi:hypothetical protein
VVPSEELQSTTWRTTTTTNFRMALIDLLRKDEEGTDPQLLRDGLRLLAQELMDAEVTEAILAAPYERTDKRLTSRNGVREREWDTRVGTMELAIPKLRQGSYFPSLLEPRRRHERALLAVVQEAYVHGVSTRNVDALAIITVEPHAGFYPTPRDVTKRTACRLIEVATRCKSLSEPLYAFVRRALEAGSFITLSD